MIDIHIRRQRPRRPIIGTIPPPAHGGAGRVLNHVRPVPLQYHFPGIAGAGLRAPVREEVAAVAGLGADGGDAEGGKLAACGGAGRDVGGSGGWEGEGEGEGDGVGVSVGGEEEGDEKGEEERGLHDGCLFWGECATRCGEE